MRRRDVLKLGAAAMAMPALARAASASTLRFVPYADLALLDPIITKNYVTRTHALMVFDTLYGLDAQYRVHPQMVAGHVVENDGLVWRLTLREGLRFHDGTPVLARDVVALRLRRPFPLLPEALAKPTSYLPAIMPERQRFPNPSDPIVGRPDALPP